ncbi:hypothetical protein SRABI106_03145 [Rahnella aquatilis]|nr:hypothetical protein SRABI106_03145 [Rahnella aquatilis]
MHQMRDHFGICFRIKTVAAFNQQFTQRFVVFDNAVMHHSNVIRHMRVSIRFRRFAMGCPSCVSNTGATMQRMFIECISQHLDFTQTTQAPHFPVSINDSQTG